MTILLTAGSKMSHSNWVFPPLPLCELPRATQGFASSLQEAPGDHTTPSCTLVFLPKALSFAFSLSFPLCLNSCSHSTTCHTFPEAATCSCTALRQEAETWLLLSCPVGGEMQGTEVNSWWEGPDDVLRR